MKIVNTLVIGLLVSETALAASARDLIHKIFNAPASRFSVNSALVYGDTESAVTDAGLTKADAPDSVPIH